MLSKLMKHEMKATSRLLIPLYLVLIFLSIINRFVIKISEANTIITVIKAFVMTSYGIMFVAVLVVTGFYMIYRFYKNLLSDEGYLMFTIPVNKHQLIVSKLLITLFWAIISILFVILSLFILVANKENMYVTMEMIKLEINRLSAQYGAKWIVILTEVIITCILSLIVNILMIYVSIAFGQLFTKHKIIGSFIAYAIIYTIIQISLLIILFVYGFIIDRNFTDFNFLPELIFPIVNVVFLIVGTCFYLTTNFIFKRKLNLE